MKVGVGAVVAFACLTVAAQAADILWIEQIANYNAPGNWLGFNVPSSSFNEVALINNGGTARLSGPNADTPAGVRIGPTVGSSGGLDILSGGTLSAVYVGGNGLGQVEVGSTTGGGSLRVLPGATLNAAGLLSSAANPSNKIELGGETAGTTSVTVGAASLAGTTTVFPAATLTATASATPGATGKVEFGATSAYSAVISSAGAGRIVSQNAMTLAGMLNVTAAAGFAPAAGATFDLLDWGSVSGTFSSISLPALGAGLAWNTSQLYASGALRVGFAADFDRDGDVDGADLVVWQRGASPNSNSPADLAAWSAAFGQPAINPSVTAAPEPGGLALGLATIALVGWKRVVLSGARDARTRRAPD